MKQASLSDIVVKADDGSYRSFYFDIATWNYVAEIAYMYFLSGVLKSVGEGRYRHPRSEDKLFSLDFPNSPILNIVVKSISTTSLTSCYRFGKQDVYDVLDRVEDEIEGIVISGKFLPKTLVKFKSENIKDCLEAISRDTAKAKYIAKLARDYYGINLADFGVENAAFIPFIRNGCIFVPVYPPTLYTKDTTLESAFNRYLIEKNDSTTPDTIHVLAKNDNWLKQLADNYRRESAPVEKSSTLYNRLFEAWSSIYGDYCLKSKIKVKNKKRKHMKTMDEIVEITIKFRSIH